MSDEPLAPSFGAELRELKGEVFAPWELVKYALNQTKMAIIFFLPQMVLRSLCSHSACSWTCSP